MATFTGGSPPSTVESVFKNGLFSCIGGAGGPLIRAESERCLLPHGIANAGSSETLSPSIGMEESQTWDAQPSAPGLSGVVCRGDPGKAPCSLLVLPFANVPSCCETRASSGISVESDPRAPGPASVCREILPQFSGKEKRAFTNGSKNICLDFSFASQRSQTLLFLFKEIYLCAGEIPTVG